METPLAILLKFLTNGGDLETEVGMDLLEAAEPELDPSGLLDIDALIDRAVSLL